MTQFIAVLCTFCLVTHSLAQMAPKFEYGPRPQLSVFDPKEILKPEIVKEISDPLRLVYEKEGIDVMVVILTDIGVTSPELIAGRFAEAWCKSPVHCVVLHVPKCKDSPWIIPGGKLIEHLKLEEIEQTVAAAKRRVSSEPNDADKVKASATEAADMLRFWMGNAVNRSEMIQKKSAIFRQVDENRNRARKLAMIVAAACAVPLIFGISILIMFFRNRGARIFPDCVILPRLGAPHAGGNRAVAVLGPPRL